MALNEEFEQKLAALALDALEADERDAVESRLGSDPAAAAEAARLQETAASRVRLLPRHPQSACVTGCSTPRRSGGLPASVSIPIRRC